VGSSSFAPVICWTARPMMSILFQPLVEDSSPVLNAAACVISP